MAYIEFNNVTKEYKTGETSIKALDGASFSVEKGELAVILGSSGAGKTTALNILGGMDVPTAGGIKVDGRDIERRRLPCTGGTENHCQFALLHRK